MAQNIIPQVDEDQAQRLAALMRSRFITGHNGDPTIDPQDLERVQKDERFVYKFAKQTLALRGDENDCYKMLLTTLQFRLNYNVNNLTFRDIDEELLQKGICYPRGIDKENADIVYILIRLHKKDKEKSEQMKRFSLYFLEKHDQYFPTRRMSLMLDCSEAGLSNMDVDFVKFLINLFKSYYPLKLGYIFVYEMPWILNAGWSIIKNWLPPAAKAKMKFVNKSDIQQYVDASQLSPRYGGTDMWVYRYPPTQQEVDSTGIGRIMPLLEREKENEAEIRAIVEDIAARSLPNYHISSPSQQSKQFTPVKNTTIPTNSNTTTTTTTTTNSDTVSTSKTSNAITIDSNNNSSITAAEQHSSATMGGITRYNTPPGSINIDSKSISTHPLSTTTTTTTTNDNNISTNPVHKRVQFATNPNTKLSSASNMHTSTPNASSKSIMKQNTHQHMGILLDVEPHGDIVFYTGDDPITATIKLYNLSNDKTAYKIKTTSLNKFKVQPTMGIINENGCEIVTVTCVANVSFDQFTDDKFLIQSTSVLPDSKSGKTELNSHWKTIPSAVVLENRLKCKMILGASPSNMPDKSRNSNNDKTSSSDFDNNVVMENIAKLCSKVDKIDKLVKTVYVLIIVLTLSNIILGFSFLYM